jgi:hypothetical protein
MKKYDIYLINGHMSAPTALALTVLMKEGRMVFLFHATGSMAYRNACHTFLRPLMYNAIRCTAECMKRIRSLQNHSFGSLGSLGSLCPPPRPPPLPPRLPPRCPPRSPFSPPSLPPVAARASEPPIVRVAVASL